MTTYTLIHGAWHGSWIWNRTKQLLQKAGHTVYTPNLPGHCEDRADFTKINLALYTSAIVDLIRSIPSEVVLVGHSMAGIVISQVAEIIPDRIKMLIYLAAFVPEKNGSLMEEEQKGIKRNVMPEVLVDQEKCSISIEHSKNLRNLFYNKCTFDFYQYALSYLQDQPLQPFSDKVALTDKRFGTVPKTYIECLEDNAISIEDQRRMYSKIQCEIFTLATDHSPFFSDIESLCSAITGASA